jgi:hypothetical protein
MQGAKCKEETIPLGVGGIGGLVGYPTVAFELQSLRRMLQSYPLFE